MWCIISPDRHSYWHRDSCQQSAVIKGARRRGKARAGQRVGEAAKIQGKTTGSVLHSGSISIAAVLIILNLILWLRVLWKRKLIVGYAFWLLQVILKVSSCWFIFLLIGEVSNSWRGINLITAMWEMLIIICETGLGFSFRRYPTIYELLWAMKSFGQKNL